MQSKRTGVDRPRMTYLSTEVSLSPEIQQARNCHWHTLLSFSLRTLPRHEQKMCRQPMCLLDKSQILWRKEKKVEKKKKRKKGEKKAENDLTMQNRITTIVTVRCVKDPKGINVAGLS